MERIPDRDCSNLSGLERDQCVSMLAREASNGTLCASIENPLVRDVCLLDAIQGEALLGEINIRRLPETCALVVHPLFRYQCLSLFSRRTTIGSPRELPPASAEEYGPSDCDALDVHHRPWCTYARAAGAARSNLEYAESECSQLKTKEEVYCLQYGAWALIMDGEAENPNGRERLMGVCRRIPDNETSAACFSLAAFEMARTGAASPSGEIATALNASPIVTSADLDDLFAVVDDAEIVSICQALGTRRERLCYERYSFAIPEEVPNNPELGIARCQRLPSEYQAYCLLALARQMGLIELDPLRQNIPLCGEFVYEYRMECFAGLSHSLAVSYATGERGPDETLEACGQFPLDVREGCFQSLGTVITSSLGPSSAMEFCLGLEEKHVTDCFMGVAHSTRSLLSRDFSVARGLCLDFPVRFREDCYTILSAAIADESEQDTALAVSRCGMVPTTYRSGCFRQLVQYITKDAEKDRTWALARCLALPSRYRTECQKALS